MLYRFYYKLKRELYRFSHPMLWGKSLQINGIPHIGNMRKLSLGRNVSINENVYIQCSGGVTMGNSVTISYGCTILTTGLDTNNYNENCICKYRKHILKPVVIGDGVWLCADVKVMPGVNIAKHIIVGAGAVVTKSLDKEGWLYAGVPAKPIKSLS